MRILIGYDGSEYSDAIFDDLKHAGLPRESDVKIVSVADLLMSNPPVEEVVTQVLTSRRFTAAHKQAETHAERVIEESERFASRAVERLRAEFPEWNVTSEVITGTPVWELLDAASDWDADLIVVGSQGRSAIGRFFLGSVSKKIATDARSSVRIARQPAVFEDKGEPTRIIIGVDGSPASEQAIYEVGRRVWQSGTEVKLVAVDDATPPARIAARLPQAAQMINSYFQSREARVASMLDWAIEQLNNIGLKTSVLTEKGDPLNILLSEARQWNAHNIFVGTRDFKNAFERFRLGSVSSGVVTNAPCTVEVVRPTIDHQQE